MTFTPAIHIITPTGQIMDDDISITSSRYGNFEIEWKSGGEKQFRTTGEARIFAYLENISIFEIGYLCVDSH